MAALRALSDAELVLLLKEGDKEAYAEIYERFKAVLFLHAFRMLQDKEDARDVIQDIFANIWTKHKEIQFTAGLNSYLYASVRNRVLDLISKKKSESIYLTSLRSFIAENRDSADHLLRENQLAELIEKEIAALPPKMREVFELSRKANLTHQEIADQLELSPATVKKQVNNALKTLRLKLGAFSFLVYFI